MSDQLDGTNKGPGAGGPHPLAPRPTFKPGDAVPGLSSWVLERKLGGGGFGEVWLTTHALRKEKPRAVKFCFDSVAKTRLVTHEKNVVARVMKYAGDHPNIVPLLDYSLEIDIPWLMYEFVEGGMLASLIPQWRDLELSRRLGRAVPVLYGVAKALTACHRLSPPLVHRDMKPHNILMAGRVPRITDFGIGGVVIPAQAPGETSPHTAYGAPVAVDDSEFGHAIVRPARAVIRQPAEPARRRVRGWASWRIRWYWPIG